MADKSKNQHSAKEVRERISTEKGSETSDYRNEKIFDSGNSLNLEFEDISIMSGEMIRPI